MAELYFDPDTIQELDEGQQAFEANEGVDEVTRQQDFAEQQRLVEQLQPQAVGKQGPGYYEDGVSPDTAPKPSGFDLWRAENRRRSHEFYKREDTWNPNQSTKKYDRQEDPAYHVTIGVGDTAVGFLNFALQGNLGTGDLQDQWHKDFPTGKNALGDMTRQISGLIIPSALIPGAIIGQVDKLSWAAKLPSAVKFLGAGAARMGVDTTILASSTSATDDNMAKVFGDTFGVYAPWANKDSDSPDVRWKLNMYENAGFLLGFEVIGGIFRYRTAIANALSGTDYFTPQDFAKLDQRVPTGSTVRWDDSAVVTPQTDEAAEILSKNVDDLAQQSKHPELQAIDEQIDALGPLDELGEASEQRLAELVEMRKRVQVDIDDIDPVTSAAMQARHARANTIKEEALEFLDEVQSGEFNPLINDPALAQQRAVTNVEGDIVGAVLDHDRILNKINVDNGRARAVLPTKGMRTFNQADKSLARSEYLEEFSGRIPDQIEAIYENKWTRTAEELNATVDKLVSDMYNMDPNELRVMLHQMRTNIQEGYNTGFLDDESFVAVSHAFRRMFDEMYDPKRMKASALITQQAADSITDAAHAADVLDGSVDTTRLMDNALLNMETVNAEIRANRFLWGHQGKVLQMANDPNPRVAQKLQQMVADFDENLKAAKANGKQVIQSLRDINEQSPQYLNAFKKAYDRTDGDVDTLFKLHRWAENNIGLIKKGFIDTQPEVPSLVIQGIHGIQYNGLLNGLAPVNATLGGSILLIGKPISVFAGAGVRGRFGDFRRAIATYGGISENIQRATKHLAKEWDFVRKNPELAMVRGRADVKFANSESFEAMEAMAEGWRADNKNGKLFMLNSARVMSWYNNNQWFRYGINALYSIDGFTNSMISSGTARAAAYAEFMDDTKGLWSDEMFLARTQQLYDKSFDKTGLLTNEAAKLASQEVALNLDNKVVRGLDTIIEHVPALKPLFRFARTGVNGTMMYWSYSPQSALGLAVGKARTVFKAKTQAEKIAAMVEHGIKSEDFTDIAFETLKNEYRGRQVMGSAVTLAAGLYAANGNLTGPGPRDAKERADMEKLGAKWFSIRNPFTGEWHSYRGLEPYDKILSTAAQIWYESDRVDSSVAEDWYLKLAWGISANVTNSTFLSGMQPLVGLLGNDETAWQRFIEEGHINPTIPFAHAGLRSILNKAITPQLKDVTGDIGSYLMNRNKFLFPRNDNLKDQIDVYTGDRINYTDPMISSINAILPVFKQNGGMEPWRQWLIGTGWDGLHEKRMDPNVPGKKLSDDERWFVNTWIAKHAGLQEQIIELMQWDQLNEKGSMAHYKEQRGWREQADFPVSQTRVHKELTRMHNIAFDNAWHALELERASTRDHSLLEQYKREAMNRGDYDKADTVQEQIENLIRLQKPLN